MTPNSNKPVGSDVDTDTQTESDVCAESSSEADQVESIFTQVNKMKISTKATDHLLSTFHHGDDVNVISVSGNELKRRLVHVSGTVLPILYVADIISWSAFEIIMIGGAVTAALLEGVRLLVGLDWHIYDELTRSYEEHNIAGYALYAFSSTVVIIVFIPLIAVPAMMMLTLGDPISGLLGTTRAAGESKRPRTLVTMFTVCFIIGMVFLFPAAGIKGVVAAGVAATGATVADGIKPVIGGYVIDDNVSIPLIAANGASIILVICGYGPVILL
ncbi:dolichol kinase [Haloquadratum walsbyi]|uniref:Dolichol kinase n=1 Tax=Haloquadratum walsbyi J07HQW2 TaxID=1238425 RepID=U1PU58_9EURY|nr:MAG: Dolichol kinase [Haloquadratum walsbyi J07HQW2]